MAGGNVIRQDVVQISFDVLDNPMQEVQEMVNSLTGKAKAAVSSVDGITKEAKEAADSVADIGTAAKEMSSNASSMSEPIKETAESAEEAEVRLSSMVKALASNVTGKIKSLPTVIKSSAQAAREFAASLKANVADGAIKGVQKLKSGLQAVKNLKLSDIANGLDKGLGKAVTTAKKLASNLKETIVSKFSGGIEKLKSKFSGVNSEAKKLPDELNEANSATNELSGGFSILKGAIANLAANALTSLASGIKDLVSSTIEVGKTFEASMSNVAALSGATGADLQMLEDTAKQFGATTQFSASEAADALGFMALAGWDATQSSEALGGVLNLAAASGMELASASDMVTDYLSAFGMEASQSSYFADMLSYAQANSNTSAEQLGEAFKNCAANMNAAGQDVETTTSLLSMLANQGLKGSEAGTALAATMRDITAKMENGAIAIGNTAVQVMDANGNYRDMTEILADVEKATQGMGDAEKAAALSSTFTADSIKGLNMLLNAGVGDAAEFEKALRESGGSAEEMARIMNDNLQGDLKSLSSAFEAVQLSIFDKMNPALRAGTQYLNELVLELNELITTANSPMELGAGLGSMLMDMLSDIVSYVPKAVSMIGEFTAGLVSGIGQGAPQLITAFTQAILDTVKSLTDLIPQFVDAGIDLLNGLVDGILQAVPMLLEQAPIIINDLRNAALDGTVALLEAGTQIIQKILDGIDEWLPQIMTAGQQIITDFASSIMNYLPKIIQLGVRLLLSLIQGIAQMLPQLIATAVSLITLLLNTLMQMLPQLLVLGIQAIFQLISGILSVLPQLVIAAIQLLTSFIQTLLSMLPQLVTIGIQAIMMLLDGIISALPQIVVAGFQIILQLVQSIVTLLPQLIITGIQLIIQLVLGILSSIGKIFEAGVVIVETLVDCILTTNWLEVGWEIIKGLAQGIWNGIKSVASSVGSWIKGLFTGEESGEDITASVSEIGSNAATSYANGITGSTPTVTAATTGLANSVTSGLTINTSAQGMTAGNTYASGMNMTLPTVSTSATSLASTANAGLSTTNGFGIGSAAGQNFSAGMNMQLPSVSTAANGLSAAADLGLASSGSFDIGNTLTSDYASGITASTGTAVGAAQNLASTVESSADADIPVSVDTAPAMEQMNSLKSSISATLNAINADVTSQFTRMGTQMNSLSQNASASVIATLNSMKATISGMSLYSAGVNIMQGLANGMNSMRGSLISTAQSIATSISSTINKALDIHSPSRVLEKTGEFVDLGAIKGMKNLLPDVAQTSFEVGETISTSADIGTSYDNAPVSGGGNTTTTNNYNPTFVLNMNGASATDDNKRKVKQWIREALKEVFDDMDNDNPEVWEV